MEPANGPKRVGETNRKQDARRTGCTVTNRKQPPYLALASSSLSLGGPRKKKNRVEEVSVRASVFIVLSFCEFRFFIGNFKRPGWPQPESVEGTIAAMQKESSVQQFITIREMKKINTCIHGGGGWWSCSTTTEVGTEEGRALWVDDTKLLAFHKQDEVVGMGLGGACGGRLGGGVWIQGV
jgi:hypothetical protein